MWTSVSTKSRPWMHGFLTGLVSMVVPCESRIGRAVCTIIGTPLRSSLSGQTMTRPPTNTCVCVSDTSCLYVNLHVVLRAPPHLPDTVTLRSEFNFSHNKITQFDAEITKSWRGLYRPHKCMLLFKMVHCVLSVSVGLIETAFIPTVLLLRERLTLCLSVNTDSSTYRSTRL
jgi:hypothetical protein